MVVRCRGMRTAKALVLLGFCACGGGKSPTTTTSPNQPTTPTAPVTLTPTPAPAAVDPCDDVVVGGATAAPIEKLVIPDSSEPEFFPPAWKKVAVGQTISFSTAVIVHDLD